MKILRLVRSLSLVGYMPRYHSFPSLCFRFTALIVAFLCLLCSLPASAGPMNAKSAILMDVTTGRVLYEQRADMRIAPASLTKVLSMFVAMEAISARKADYNSIVTVSRNAARTRGSTMKLKTGDRVTLDKLFYGMAVASGNDASMAVAEHIAGSSDAFVGRMNTLARRLGMKNSRFVNVHGLPDDRQYTTARDMLKMARSYEAKYPRARKYHLAKSVTHNRHTEPNHNPLVGYYRGLTGLKTGWITAAGYNIIASAKRDGHKLIAVILGAPSTEVRAAEARRLLNAGFRTLGKKKTVATDLGVNARQAKILGISPVDFAKKKKAPQKVKRTPPPAKKHATKTEKAKPKPSKKQVAAKPKEEKRRPIATSRNSSAHKKTEKTATPPAKKAPAKVSPPPAKAALSPADEALAAIRQKNAKP